MTVNSRLPLTLSNDQPPVENDWLFGNDTFAIPKFPIPRPVVLESMVVVPEVDKAVPFTVIPCDAVTSVKV